MSTWTEEQLRDAVSKKGNLKATTDIICKFFLDAVSSNLRYDTLLNGTRRVLFNPGKAHLCVGDLIGRVAKVRMVLVSRLFFIMSYAASSRG